VVIIDTEFNYCSNHELIDLLVSTIEAKDEYTNGHSNRVADITSWICEELDITEKVTLDIHIAAHLHDIGKIKVPDHILNKSEKLLPEEWKQIKNHPVVGYNLLSNVNSLKDIAKIVLHHHERWDGKGYPNNLCGITIPFGSRVITIADSIDAMLSDRPYRKAMEWSECKKELIGGIGKQFDAELIDKAITVCENRKVWEYMEENK
jgi:putative nucleotidyltransferase with HDIG domain